MYNGLLAVTVATVIIESLFYGILLISFFTNLYLRLSRWRKTNHSSSHSRMKCDFVVISSTAIFVMCTAHWIITVVRFSHGLLNAPDIPSTLLYFTDGSQILQVVRSALGEITLLIGDAVIVYRLWLMWNGDWRVVLLPALSWLGSLACVIAVAFIFHSSIGQDVSVRYKKGWLTVNWVLTAVTNTYCTTLIAWKVWSTTRAVRAIKDEPFTPVLAIVVESAAIWTAWLLFFAITCETGSVLQSLATVLTPSVLGLVNMFIHIRVELGWSSQTQMTMTSPASILVWGSTSLTAADPDFVEGAEIISPKPMLKELPSV
ncbi:hypothetical protein K438DRAFT_1584912 [Mycena galopus ATCC 62051]|nr:hypothetical protein K438DRAFT_1584912 [Mycena galopus ATCC 62051]